MLSQLFINFDSLIYKKIDKNILFEYNGASCHTSKSNKQLLNYLFDAKGWIQNSPSSPNLAYPIEALWAELKDKVGVRDPKTYEELKQYYIEEWNKIAPKKYFKNFESKIKLCKEINGEKLKEYNLKEIRKNVEKKVEKENKNEIKKLKRGFQSKILKIFKNKRIEVT